MKMVRWLGFLWMTLVVVGLCATAGAQVELQRFQRQLEQIQRETRFAAPEGVPASQRALIEYGGYLTFNYLDIDDTDQRSHILRQTSFSGFVGVNVDGVHEFFARGRTSYRDYNDGDAFDEHGDDWIEPTLDRAHYRFNLRRAVEAYDGRTINGNLIIQVGRQLVHWANGLTLSREIDGGQVTASYGPFTLGTVAGMTRNSTTDFDASRPEFSSKTRRGFFGGMASFQASPRHRPYVYGLVQQDFNRSFETSLIDVFATPGDTSDDVITRFNYETWYLGVGSTGSLGDRLVYAIEVVYEGGEGLSNSISALGEQLVQTNETISAWAADVRLDFLFNDPNRSRLSGELIIASGDDDRLTATNTVGGNRSGTDDRGFNAFGLVNTGLAHNPNVSNIIMLRGGISTFPLPGNALFRRLQVGANVFLYLKYDPNAPTDEEIIGTTAPISNNRYLGVETDLFVNWQVVSDVSITMRYGVFFPGEGHPQDGQTRHFLFTGVTFAF